MSKYMNWELYDKPPEGFFIDKHTGSPLTGYDFYTNGKSILNGGVRILVKAPDIPVNNKIPDSLFMDDLKPEKKGPKQDPMTSQDIRKKVNVLARNRFKEKLLYELEFDLMVCKLEGWSMEGYVCELKQLIDDIYRKAKNGKKKVSPVNELKLEF